MSVSHSELRSALLARQNADGGLGARPGLPSATEPTALAVLALSFEPEPTPTEPLRAWLRAAQTPEHGWPVMAGRPRPSRTTAPAVLALARVPVASGGARQRGQTAVPESWPT